MANKSGLLYFHQGFTDIINSLPLIDYYMNKHLYEHIYIVIREDAFNITIIFT